MQYTLWWRASHSGECTEPSIALQWSSCQPSMSLYPLCGLKSSHCCCNVSMRVCVYACVCVCVCVYVCGICCDKYIQKVSFQKCIASLNNMDHHTQEKSVINFSWQVEWSPWTTSQLGYCLLVTGLIFWYVYFEWSHVLISLFVAYKLYLHIDSLLLFLIVVV